MELCEEFIIIANPNIKKEMYYNAPSASCISYSGRPINMGFMVHCVKVLNLLDKKFERLYKSRA